MGSRGRGLTVLAACALVFAGGATTAQAAKHDVNWRWHNLRPVEKGETLKAKSDTAGKPFGKCRNVFELEEPQGGEQQRARFTARAKCGRRGTVRLAGVLKFNLSTGVYSGRARFTGGRGKYAGIKGRADISGRVMGKKDARFRFKGTARY